MSDNKRTVETYMEGFRTTDRRAILSCVTDDVQWEIPGMFHIQGRDAFNSHIVDPGFAGNPVIEVTRLTEENDVVIAEGFVRTQHRDGTMINLAMCDVCEMRDGKIRRLTSYLMNLA